MLQFYFDSNMKYTRICIKYFFILKTDIIFLDKLVKMNDLWKKVDRNWYRLTGICLEIFDRVVTVLQALLRC